MNEAKYFKYSIYVIIFFAIASIALIISATSKFGPGISEDSVAYLATARNILNGRGFSVLFDLKGNQINLYLPMQYKELYHVLPWPPLFPFIISIFGFAGFNLIKSARWINAILFGANIALILLIIRKYTKSLLLIIFAAVIFITSKYMFVIHSYVWSEPLFLFLSLLGFYFLFYFLENNKIYNFLISSLSFSLAFFTRILGISLIAAGVIVILFFSELKIKKRIVYSLLFTVTGFLPFLIWTLINKFIYGYTSPEFSIYPFKFENLKEAVGVVTSWFDLDIMPFKMSLILLAIILAAIIFVSIYISIKVKKRSTESSDNAYKLNSRIINIFLIFAFFYIFALLSARLFFIANITVDGRYLIPVFISTFIIIILLVKRSLDYFKNKKNIKFIIYIFCEILFMFTLAIMILGIKDFYEEGQGYASKEWSKSDTIRELKVMNSNVAIYTNDPYAVYFYLDKNPNPFPTKINIYTNKKNANYTDDLNKTIEEIREKDALIVLFDSGQYYLTEEKELLKNYKLILIKDTQDGAIYKVR
ncbi:MAG: glycosyltransferase family 39 protein [Cyanobacteria bacterium]|nr:glycosyltransferase family 39 protein [Cyanobacteriota bacterium]